MKSECVTPELKEQEQLKFLTITKSSTADKLISKRGNVECSDYCDKIKATS